MQVREIIAKQWNLRLNGFPNYWHLRPRMTEDEFRKKYVDADDFNPGWLCDHFLIIDKLAVVPYLISKQDREMLIR